MTKGELISACLKLMFENNEQIDADIVSSDLDYRYETLNIIESINRAFIRLSQLDKLPIPVLKISYDEDQTEEYTQYDLNSLSNNSIMGIENIYLVKESTSSLSLMRKIAYFPNNIIMLPKLEEGYKYHIYYKSLPLKLKNTDDDILELPYPDYICGIVPYFVKGDLYEETNPNLALLSRNMFESYASDLPNVYENANHKQILDVFDYLWR